MGRSHLSGNRSSDMHTCVVSRAVVDPYHMHTLLFCIYSCRHVDPVALCSVPYSLAPSGVDNIVPGCYPMHHPSSWEYLCGRHGDGDGWVTM